MIDSIRTAAEAMAEAVDAAAVLAETAPAAGRPSLALQPTETRALLHAAVALAQRGEAARQWAEALDHPGHDGLSAALDYLDRRITRLATTEDA